jgi:hypothetical protein
VVHDTGGNNGSGTTIDLLCLDCKFCEIMMKIYIGNYWIPFPSSEYGGQWVVIASDEQEACDILKENAWGHYDNYDHLIPHAVKESESFD